MEEMKIVRFKGDFEVDLFRDIHLRMFFDENLDKLAEEERDGLGVKYIFSCARVIDSREDEVFEYQYYFPLDGDIENIQDLFLNELELVLKYWRKCAPVEWVTKSNPDCAWIFYKKTLENVLHGEEFRKSYKCNIEIECERPDGKHIIMKQLEHGLEGLYWDDKYLGLVDLIKGNQNEIVYDNLSIYWESGIHIYHKGHFSDIVEGLGLAADEFLSRM